MGRPNVGTGTGPTRPKAHGYPWAVSVNQAKIRQISPALVEIEPVADEELVRHGESDVLHGQVVDEPTVGPVEEHGTDKRRRPPERERPAEVVHGQPRVDDLVDEDD